MDQIFNSKIHEYDKQPTYLEYSKKYWWPHPANFTFTKLWMSFSGNISLVVDNNLSQS